MSLRYRQVHMDFHTSQYITEVGRDFSAEEFAQTLEQAHVNSVTCFARCHHGWLYYPSKTNPELIHPNLVRKNLLLEQIEACHRRGIRVPVYTTVRWDERIIREKPEWLCRDINGNYVDRSGAPQPHFYYDICLNSGYREFFKEHVRDIIDVVGADNLDGLFMDIVTQTDCACENCRRMMKERGMDPDSGEERLKFAARTLNDFRAEISALIRQYVPDAGIFYNDNCIDHTLKESAGSYTHMELESLASGDWGYDHFPAAARYASVLGKDMIGMTGKFHTSWGDFYSLKNRAALEFECFHMLALGAGCSVGDQLHPYGRLSEGTYRLIGSVYESVEEKEAYCIGAHPAAEIAVLRPWENYNPVRDGRDLPEALTGVCHILQELACQFTVVDSESDLKLFRLVVLPDHVEYSEQLVNKLQEYVKSGGKLLATFDSCLDKNGGNEILGVRVTSESKYSREFVIPNETIGKKLSKEPYVMYKRGKDIVSFCGEVLMEKTEPWFEREGKTFCSHLHAPSPLKDFLPEIIRNGNAVYCAHPLFEIYRKNAPAWCREIVRDVLDLLLPDRMTEHDGPSGMICILNNLEKNTQILHLLYYIPEKKSRDIYTIEDVVPLYNVQVKILTDGRTPESVKAVPEKTAIPWKMEKDRLVFQVPVIRGHCMIEVGYKDE